MGRCQKVPKSIFTSLLKWRPIFDSSPLTQISKFNNFLWVCWVLGKNLSNFVPPVLKLHNPYCHKCRLTWHPIWPPTMRPMSVCDHRLLAHGSIYFRLCVKFTVSNLLWTNLRMFQGKSLCLKINKKRYLVNHYMHTKSNILWMNNIIFCNFLTH